MRPQRKVAAKQEPNAATLYAERLAESGLTKEHAKKLALRLLEPTATKALAPHFHKQAAIRIPYFSPDGKPTSFYRLRYLGKAPGFEGQSEKPQRYAQAKDTINEVYLPPLLEQEWFKVMADKNVPIVFTEGEFKAACGCANGFPVIGLGGVDVFRSRKHQMSDLLPILADIEWKGRDVYIVWDSDVAIKEGPIKAQHALAYRLLKRGAIPHLLGLPSDPALDKVGLDDFLVRHGSEAFQTLLDESPQWEESEALWLMNEECVAVVDPPLIIGRRPKEEQDLYMAPRMFADYQFANKTVMVDGQAKSVAKEWLKWPQRFQVERMVYQPGQPRMSGGKWNTWRGWGVEARAGDVKPFHDLVDFLFQRESEEAKQWFLRWLAYPIQNPGAKLLSAVLFWGVEGGGKSFIGEIMRDIYGRTNSSKIGNQELHAPFNKWAWNKQFILAEEVTGSDKRADADHLKELVTGETITINEKYLPAMTFLDCANYYLTSNHANALYLSDRDRRYFINHVTDIESDAFYKRIDTWRFKQDGPAHLRYYLEHVDLGDFNPKARPVLTYAKEEMISDGRSEMARWVYELTVDPARTLALNGQSKAAKECDLWTPAQLYRIFNPEGNERRGTINGLARELRTANVFKACEGRKVLTKTGPQTFYMVRNKEKWNGAEPKAAAAHWEAYFVSSKVAGKAP